MHLSRNTFVGTRYDASLELHFPATVHRTYCGREAHEEHVGSEDVATCDECIVALCWEEIDRQNCETHLGG
jgi:hypothetical protein